MPLPTRIPTMQPGPRLIDGSDIQRLIDLEASIQGGVGQPVVVANPGGGQANATMINAALVNVGTVATAGDSVVLPYAIAGMKLLVVNSGAASMQVFGQAATGDTINGQATATGVAQAAGTSALYWCPVASSAGAPARWFRLLSA